MKNMSVKKIVAMIVGAVAVLAVAAVACRAGAASGQCGGSTDRAGYRRRRGDRLTGGQQ
ncbi:MAG: hypothetical protein ACLTG0_08010 [Oscillibacter sp.]